MRVRRIRKLRLLAVVVAFGLLGVAMFNYGLVVSIRSQLPELDPSKHREQQNGYVYARDGRSVLLVLRGDESRTIVPDEAISPWVKYAIVAIEDRRFWEHRGVDVRGIVRAAWEDVTQGGLVQGGSTITQQFVKQAFVSSQRTIARKLREAAFAWQLEQRWSKTKILNAYLNTIFFGNQAYGVEQASRIYFGHSAKEMTIAEAALLAGIPKDPSLYDPITHPQEAKFRRQQVLDAMLEQRLIDLRQYREAQRTPLPTAEDIQHPAVQGKAPYFANYVREQLLDTFKRDKVYGGGLRVRTTIDLGLQRLAQDAVQKWLPEEDGPHAALVAMDAHTGAVLAMIGGRNYNDSQFNLATQRNRQVGSSFKPIVLATALRQGIAPQTVFQSGTITLNADGRLWQVENYEGESLGQADLVNAMVHSDNSIFAQLTALVGPKNVAKTAELLGIDGLRGYFSIGLGSEAVSPVEMARAYAAFANGGYRVDASITGNRPRVISALQEGANGDVRYNDVVRKPVLTEDQAATIDQILQGVVRSGTGKGAALPGWQVAGKTGTTENYGDAWFVGYTPGLVVAVWVGYPKKLVPMLTEYRGQPVAGGNYPALIFRSFMEKALPYLKADRSEAFPVPQPAYVGTATVVQRKGRLHRDNGYCQNARTVAFYGGFDLPTADCKPNEVEVPRVVGQSLAAARARLEAQPLTAEVIYKPARPRQRLGVVLGQFPSGGTLSSHETVRLVLAKPQHGVVPKLVGLELWKAKATLRKRGLRVVVHGDERGEVVAQQPAGGVAAAPGMTVTVAVAAD